MKKHGPHLHNFLYSKMLCTVETKKIYVMFIPTNYVFLFWLYILALLQLM